MLLLPLSWEQAITLYEKRDFPAAEKLLRQHLAAASQDRAARLYLARTLIDLHRLSEAVTEIDRALAGTANPETRFEAGAILRELAEHRLRQLVASAPDSAAVRELTGQRLEWKGNLDAALAEYREAAAREPRRSGIHYRIGSLLWRKRDLDAAEAELRVELALTPGHGTANLRLGQVLAARGDDQAAIGPLEQAVKASPGLSEARRELGKAYQKTGKLAAAREQWETVARASPSDGQIHYLLGNLYAQLGERVLAEQSLQRHRALLEKRRKLSETR